MCNLAYQAVKTVANEINGLKEIDIKRYARVEKVCFLFLIYLFFTFKRKKKKEEKIK